MYIQVCSQTWNFHFFLKTTIPCACSWFRCCRCCCANDTFFIYYCQNKHSLSFPAHRLPLFIFLSFFCGNLFRLWTCLFLPTWSRIHYLFHFSILSVSSIQSMSMYALGNRFSSHSHENLTIKGEQKTKLWKRAKATEELLYVLYKSTAMNIFVTRLMRLSTCSLKSTHMHTHTSQKHSIFICRCRSRHRDYFVFGKALFCWHAVVVVAFRICSRWWIW